MALVEGFCLVVAARELAPGTLETMDPAIHTHCLQEFELYQERESTTQEPLLPYRGDRPPIPGQFTPNWSSRYYLACTTVFDPLGVDDCKEAPFFNAAGLVRDSSLDVIGSLIAPYGTHEMSWTLQEQDSPSMSVADMKKGTQFNQFMNAAGCRSGFKINLEYAKPFDFMNDNGKGVIYTYGDEAIPFAFETNNLASAEYTVAAGVKVPRVRYRSPVSCLRGTGILVAENASGANVFEYPFGDAGRGMNKLEIDGRSELITPRTMEGNGGVSEVIHAARKPVSFKLTIMAAQLTEFNPDYICDNNLRLFFSYSVDAFDNFPGETDYIGLDFFGHLVSWKPVYIDKVLYWELTGEVTARDLNTNQPGALRLFKGHGMLEVKGVKFNVEEESPYGLLVWAQKHHSRLKRALMAAQEKLKVVDKDNQDELISLQEEIEEGHYNGVAVRIAIHVHNVEGDLSGISSLLKGYVWPSTLDTESMSKRLEIVRLLPASVVASLNKEVSQNYAKLDEVEATKKS